MVHFSHWKRQLKGSHCNQKSNSKINQFKIYIKGILKFHETNHLGFQKNPNPVFELIKVWRQMSDCLSALWFSQEDLQDNSAISSARKQYD